MTENLPDHEHCAQCDDAIPTGQRFCSPECEAAFSTKQRKERQRNLLFIVTVVVAFVVLGIVSVLMVK